MIVAAAATGPNATTAGRLRILFLDDQVADCELVVRSLEKAGYRCEWTRVDDEPSFLAALEKRDFAIVLADYHMPTFDGLSALRLFVERGSPVPFILVSGTLGEEVAIEALKAGATDYVLKTRLSRLPPVVKRALAEDADKRERLRAEAALYEEAIVSEGLALVSRELISDLNSRALLPNFCRVTAEVLGLETSHTLLRDEERRCFRPLANQGTNPNDMAVLSTIEVPEQYMEMLLDRLAGEEIAEVSMVPAEMAPSSGGPPRRMVCLALRRGEDIIGIQVLGNRGRDASLGPMQKRIASGISQLASLALNHARLVTDLERANRVKSDFVATMSHELRTPLHIIIGYTDLLLAGGFGALSTEQREIVGRVSRSAARLHDLVRWTLDLSRLEAGRLPVRIASVDIGELVAEVMAETSEVHDKPAVQLSSAIAEDVPPWPTDREKLSLVLKNLIDNALKFTARGTMTVEVSRPSQSEISIAVSDTGPGISESDRERIFESFVQLEDVLTRVHGGAGLGLHVARKLIELLGGTIQVQSTVGEGSRFEIRLPEPTLE
jgi:signal transduction histidine kinase/CheY-like chemotaxis protein